MKGSIEHILEAVVVTIALFAIITIISALTKVSVDGNSDGAVTNSTKQTIERICQIDS